MEIKYSKSALKFLKRQNKPTQQRLISAIEKLPAGDIVKLKSISGFRLRVGTFLVLYDISGNIIDIIDIGNRGQIYN